MNRQIKLLDGEVHTFFISGERNPCNCGSNCFHKENDKTKTYGVCNACGADIYEYKEKEVFEEWKWKNPVSEVEGRIRMTHGDLAREIRKDSLFREIQRLEDIVKGILNNDGDSCETDPDIQAYKKVVAEKKKQLENL
jgi:hypothetical protein